MNIRNTLTMLCLLLSVTLFAKDIKIGEAKYEILKDGTVSLKEYKKLPAM